MKLYTIGFTQKSAQRFFELLGSNGVQCLVDTRLRPGSQLSGFAKQDDLQYFLDRLIGCRYQHLPILAPNDALLGQYRKDHNWARYEAGYAALMDAHNVPAALDRGFFENRVCCLLCSEAKPERCHRRLAAERMERVWGDVEMVHLA